MVKFRIIKESRDKTVLLEYVSSNWWKRFDTSKDDFISWEEFKVAIQTL